MYAYVALCLPDPNRIKERLHHSELSSACMEMKRIIQKSLTSPKKTF